MFRQSGRDATQQATAQYVRGKLDPLARHPGRRLALLALLCARGAPVRILALLVLSTRRVVMVAGELLADHLKSTCTAPRRFAARHLRCGSRLLQGACAIAPGLLRRCACPLHGRHQRVGSVAGDFGELKSSAASGAYEAGKRSRHRTDVEESACAERRQYQRGLDVLLAHRCADWDGDRGKHVIPARGQGRAGCTENAVTSSDPVCGRRERRHVACSAAGRAAHCRMGGDRRGRGDSRDAAARRNDVRTEGTHGASSAVISNGLQPILEKRVPRLMDSKAL